tara:strand:+ start:9486 stop:9713 length:228 start_codon:yes stop_codon:yes gene_type:complete
MDVQILVTHTDFCLPNLECEFKHLGVKYSIDYIEDNANLVNTHQIKHSPSIFVDNKLVFRYQPTSAQLKALFNLN